MHPFNLVALVTLASFLLYIWMLLRVGHARSTSGVEAPAVTGHPVFERAYRVQMNTLESLTVYVASLWLFTFYWGELIAAALGVVWMLGRTLYMFAYTADPKTRSAGFGISTLALVVLLIGAIVGAVRAMILMGGL